jgi:16S rRNA G1207 methylase RsmC
MQENKNVLEQIVAAYLAEKNLDTTTELLLQEFAQYATKWLADSGIVGVGHTASGLALRFKDGREIPFFEQEASAPAIKTASMNIIGSNAAGVKNSYAIDNRSKPITGQ